MLSAGFPKELIRFQVESSGSVWIRNPLSNHFYQRSVVKFNADELTSARIFHSAMEGYRYLHVRLLPSSIHIHPFPVSLIVICITVAKLGKDLAPICMADVVWIERRVTNNVNKALEL